jgi:hypothetical protein
MNNSYDHFLHKNLARELVATLPKDSSFRLAVNPSL